MGLTKSNYLIEGTDDLLETAYAVIKNITNKNGIVTVDFAVQTDREKALKKDPREVKSVTFVWDRKTNIAAQAYSEAKKTIKTIEYNKETHKDEIVEKDGIFTGWEDDKV